MKELKVLLAEQDPNLGPILKSYFLKNGIKTILAKDGNVAMKAYSSEDIDLVILETSLPVIDGFTLAEEIRKLSQEIPIIFISQEHQDIQWKIRGFEIGGDDYICKPFEIDELICRIRAIAKRSLSEKPEDNIFDVGQYYSFDFNRSVIIFKGNETNPYEEIHLTGKERELLKVFATHINQTINRTIILQKVWRNSNYFNARSMDVYITKLRKYINKDPNIVLANQHGIGFKLLVNHKSSY